MTGSIPVPVPAGKDASLAQNRCVTSELPLDVLVVGHEEQADAAGRERGLVLEVALRIAERDAASGHQVAALLVVSRRSRVHLPDVGVERAARPAWIGRVVEVVRGRRWVGLLVVGDQGGAVLEPPHHHRAGAFRVLAREAEVGGQLALIGLEALHVLFELPVDEEAAVAVGSGAVRVSDQRRLAGTDRRIPDVDPALPRAFALDVPGEHERLAAAVDVAEVLDAPALQVVRRRGAAKRVAGIDAEQPHPARVEAARQRGGGVGDLGRAVVRDDQQRVDAGTQVRLPLRRRGVAQVARMHAVGERRAWRRRQPQLRVASRREHQEHVGAAGTLEHPERVRFVQLPQGAGRL